MKNGKKIRIMIAKVGCDIHERGALTLLTMLRDEGMEVIYTGRYQTPKGVANAAVSEDVDVLALSDHTGSLPIIAEAVLAELKELGVADMKVIAGGLLAPDDIKSLEKMGVTGNYGPGTPVDEIVGHIQSLVK
jgi:methylmalonyl-CoA mutase C-terminal domain/subunit